MKSRKSQMLIKKTKPKPKPKHGTFLNINQTKYKKNTAKII